MSLVSLVATTNADRPSATSPLFVKDLSGVLFREGPQIMRDRGLETAPEGRRPPTSFAGAPCDRLLKRLWAQ